MGSKLTITLNLHGSSGILPYALEIICDGIGNAFIAAEFEKAELDGELLIDKNGTASDNVKQLKQYNRIMGKLFDKR